MQYSKKDIEKKMEETGLPLSKVIMILENPPEKLKEEDCSDCKNKKKTIIIEKE